MKNIIVSNTTYQMIAKVARGEFKGNARQTPSSMWIVPVEDKTFEMLLGRHMSNETFDDTVQRVIMEVTGAVEN